MRTVGIGAWRLGARLGIDASGASEGPPIPTETRRRELADVVAAARAGDGTIDSAPYPVHELLTHLVLDERMLLHGSNRSDLAVLEPQPARDLDTTLDAVVAADDAIWPMFYAVLARERVELIFSACFHVGRRRFYMSAITADPDAHETWTDGTVYAFPRDGFRREWGHEWVSPDAVRPALRVRVRPEDFPLRDAVIGLERHEFRRVTKHLRAAKRERALAET